MLKLFISAIFFSAANNTWGKLKLPLHLKFSWYTYIHTYTRARVPTPYWSFCGPVK
jgi:hypothetical protein